MEVTVLYEIYFTKSPYYKQTGKRGFISENKITRL